MADRDYYRTDYSFEEIEVDPRFKICEREMKISFLIQTLFTLCTIAAAYILGRGNPEEYLYVMGLPLWWFAVIAICFVFLGVVVYITNNVFVDMDLTDEGVINHKKAA
jgi:uncharacterized membrane protein YhdT